MSDMQWLEALHRAHYSTLLRLARNRLQRAPGALAEAEDVVQEAFLLAAAKDIRSHPSPLGWLMKTVDNLCHRRVDQAMRSLDLQRRVAQQSETSSSSGFPPDIPSAAQALEALEKNLNASDWELVRLYFLEGMPVEEVARRLNIRVGALRVRLHRIRQKIRKIPSD